mmetsp:Transcript_134733/g.336220  ORF Transcript_134733/g.336220 Transcript_134733/m.336220 type:complete len:111 (-) Transcript_134733:124-456(-)
MRGGVTTGTGPPVLGRICGTGLSVVQNNDRGVAAGSAEEQVRPRRLEVSPPSSPGLDDERPTGEEGAVPARELSLCPSMISKPLPLREPSPGAPDKRSRAEGRRPSKTSA